MATLKIIDNFILDSTGATGKQGAADDGFFDAFELSVSGLVHRVDTTLATATVLTVWDDDDDKPADWNYLYFISYDVDMYIQIIGSGSNIIFKVLAGIPFTMSYDSLLAAANTTIIAGGAEPSLTDIDSIVLGNYSGTTGAFTFAVID